MPLPASKKANLMRVAAGQMVMREWFDSLSEYKPKAVLVLGPDPFDANDRKVVAVHPGEFRNTAKAMAQSPSAYGALWRLNGGALVTWRNLEQGAGGEDQRWIEQCLEQGALSVVRVEIPMPFNHGFECFVFSGRQFTDKKDPSALVWSAMSFWPQIKEGIVARHFDISRREREILMVLAEGLTTKEAGVRLGCAERTVAFHLTSIKEKLQADNRASAVTRACSLGLI